MVGLFVQTPADGDPFWSFAVASNRSPSADIDTSNSASFRGIFLSSEQDTEILLSPIQIPSTWRTNNLPMVLIPLAILKHHVQQTARDLAKLMRRVAEVEEAVVQGDTTEFDKLIRELHSCNTSLVNLQRRWHFESTLASAVCEFIDDYGKPATSFNFTVNRNVFESGVIFNISNEAQNNLIETQEPIAGLASTKEYRTLRSDAGLQSRLSRTSEYDLSVLPRRIKNQFIAVSIHITKILYHYAKKKKKRIC
jgi:hypothetical protein